VRVTFANKKKSVMTVSSKNLTGKTAHTILSGPQSWMGKLLTLEKGWCCSPRMEASCNEPKDNASRSNTGSHPCKKSRLEKGKCAGAKEQLEERGKSGMLFYVFELWPVDDHTRRMFVGNGGAAEPKLALPPSLGKGKSLASEGHAWLGLIEGGRSQPDGGKAPTRLARKGNQLPVLHSTARYSTRPNDMTGLGEWRHGVGWDWPLSTLIAKAQGKTGNDN
jgi:hypothetical protein